MDLKLLRNNSPEASQILKAMAHPVRLKILCYLLKGEASVTDLMRLSCLSKSSLSQQLTVLKKAKFVQYRKESQRVYYSLSDESIEAFMRNTCQVLS